MIKKRIQKTVFLVLAVLILLMAAEGFLFAFHKCEGDGCPVCHMLNITASAISLMLPLCVFVLISPVSFINKYDKYTIRTDFTPVSSGVRMNA